MGKAEKPVLTRPRMERYLEQPVAEASPDLEEAKIERLPVDELPAPVPVRQPLAVGEYRQAPHLR